MPEPTIAINDAQEGGTRASSSRGIGLPDDASMLEAISAMRNFR